MNGTEKEKVQEKETGDVFQVSSHAETFEALYIAFMWFDRKDVSDSIQQLLTTKADHGIGCNEKM